MNQKRMFTIGIIIVAVFLLFLIANPFKIIGPNQAGLKFTMGKISETVLSPGLNIKAPFIQSIKKVNMRAIKMDFEIKVDKDGAITKDNQTIGTTIETFYKYKKSGLVMMWKDFGKEKIEQLVKASTIESFKGIVGTYEIFELPVNREKIRNNLFKGLVIKVSGYPVEIVDVKIVNYDWSDEFDTQIKLTMQKAQQVKQKAQELEIEELEQNKKVKVAESKKAADIAEAEGKKQSIILEAEGEKESASLRKEAKVLEGEGIKEYNRLIAVNLDVEIKLIKLRIEEKRVDRWNGVYVADNNYGPIPIQTGNLKGN